MPADFVMFHFVLVFALLIAVLSLTLAVGSWPALQPGTSCRPACIPIRRPDAHPSKMSVTRPNSAPGSTS
jgi:hypothetical protein